MPLILQNATNSFTNTAQGSRFSFNGNVNVGKDVTLEQLQEVYHAVILVRHPLHIFSWLF